jgi:hypothetical protein
MLTRAQRAQVQQTLALAATSNWPPSPWSPTTRGPPKPGIFQSSRRSPQRPVRSAAHYGTVQHQTLLRAAQQHPTSPQPVQQHPPCCDAACSIPPSSIYPLNTPSCPRRKAHLSLQQGSLATKPFAHRTSALTYSSPGPCA